MNNAPKEEVLEETGTQGEAHLSVELDPIASKEETLVRPGKRSEEQRQQLNQKLESLRNSLVAAVQTHGAGQALAWLDSRSKEEEVALLQIKLCAKLEISSEDHQLLPEYSNCSSLQAVAFRQRLLDALYSMSIESRS